MIMSPFSSQKTNSQLILFTGGQRVKKALTGVATDHLKGLLALRQLLLKELIDVLHAVKLADLIQY